MNTKTALFLAIAILAAAAALLLGTAFDPKMVAADGNVTILLNVTNSPPVIIGVTVEDNDDGPADQIDLTSNGIKEVTCNATVTDLNGANDVVNATARLYSITSGWGASADNNNHYRNNSCIECRQLVGIANNASCVCRFNVQYYADSGNWECNINVSDNGGTQQAANKYYFSVNSSDTSTINGLLAMQVPITQIDFGNISATETSSMQTINITNAGNIVTNMTVRGFGSNNETLYQNISMACESGNISIGYLRYSNLSAADYNDMINLTSNSTKIYNLTLAQRTNDNAPTFGQDLNLTFWRIKVPVGVAGMCNGTIAFMATNN